MKKWYSNVSTILVLAAAVQLTGCASTSRTFARWTGRDKEDQQVAEIDGKAARESSSKARTEARRPATQASKSKSAPVEDNDDDRIVAKAIDPKSEAKSTASKNPTNKTPSKSPARDRVAEDAKIASASKPSAKLEENKDSKRLPVTPKTDTAVAKADTTKAATASKTSATKTATPKTAAAPKVDPNDPFADFDIATNDPIAPPVVPKNSVKPAVNPAAGEKRERAEIDAEFEEIIASQNPSSKAKIQEVSHRGVEEDLPEWASDAATPKTAAKTETRAATKPKKPAVSPSAVAIAKTEEPVTPDTEKAPAPKEKYAAMCPDAKGEVRELVRTLDSTDLETVKRSIHRLGRMQGDALAATPALEKLLLHRDSNVRIHSALALVRMNEVSPFVTETLILGLRSPDPSVRSFSAAVLAEMGPNSQEALPALSTALKDSDGFVRLHVAEVLIRHDDYSVAALDTLLKCLRDPDENVRWLATYSLAELAPQSLEAASSLERCLSDASPKVCVGAAYALGEIGPMARSATTSLKRCANSNDPELQAAVAYALRQVQE